MNRATMATESNRTTTGKKKIIAYNECIQVKYGIRATERKKKERIVGGRAERARCTIKAANR